MAQNQSAAIKRKVKSKYDEDFEPLRATPEAVARKIVLTPSKKAGEWKYMKKLDSRKSS
ncbi:MAG: hypothetical protein OXC26_17465 [Albidovulum sp.]|nr:hypothetical protein [Albidovulum sp.]